MATMKMTGCMALVARMPQADQDALLERLDQYQADGIPAERAQIMATRDMLEELRAERGQLMSAIAEQHPDLLTVAKAAAMSRQRNPQVDTPEFKRWFGDSKVVDAEGRPRVMYHATKGDFSVFNRLKSTEFRRPSMDTVGLWFSSEPGKAEQYAGGEGLNVMPVYLSIQNPKLYRLFDDFLRDMHEAEGREFENQNPKGIGSAEGLRAKLKAEGYDGLRFEQTDNESLYQEIQEIQDSIKRARDEEFSVKRADRAPYTMKRERLENTLRSMKAELDQMNGSTEFDGHDVYVAFDPEQVKSAIGNNGQFDPANPDITASRPRLIEDIPNDDWLQGKINYAIKKGRNKFGVPHMSTVTGYFDQPVEVPLRVLSRLKGERGEQDNVREESLKYIRENWDEVSESPPYVEVAYNGEAWVSEGNHRIMVAAEKGLESMPVEIRYFDGGQRRNGPLAPGRLSALDPSNDTAAMSRQRTPLGFYSALAEGVAGIKTNAAPAQGWKDAIKGLVNKGQVKADEVEWTGINDWLDLQEGKVTRDQVMAFLNANGVQVEETVLREVPLKNQTFWDDAYLYVENYRVGGIDTNDDGSYYFRARDRKKTDLQSSSLVDAKAEVEQLLGVETSEQMQPPKYQKYTLLGGENYREVLLTLPGVGRVPTLQEWWNRTHVGELPESGRIRQVAEARYEREKNKIGRVGTYRSSHWNQVNVLAHIRLNDRTDRDGKRVLFVEEIQSDWGQEGKKEGFDHKPMSGKVVKVEPEQSDDGWEAEPTWNIEWEDGTVSTGFLSNLQAEDALRGIASYKRAIIPSAPFVATRRFAVYKDGKELTVKDKDGKERMQRYDSLEAAQAAAKKVDGEARDLGMQANTEGWLNLALKRVAAIAAGEGYDRVAFTTGAQNAERFSLDQTLREIAYEPAGDGLYEITATDLQGREVISEDEVSLDRIEELVGKEIAEKISRGEGERDAGGYRDWHYLRGENLRVEAKGMRAFYDKIVPAAINKLVPKLGGGKLGTVNVLKDTMRMYGNEYLVAEAERLGEQAFRAKYAHNEQPGFDVTDAMRAKVEEGLPLFSRQRRDAAAAKEAIDLVRKARAYEPEEGEARIVFPILYHSGTGDPDSLAKGVEPQFGSWVSEVLSGATDEEIDAEESFVPLSYYAPSPTWIRMQTARKLGKGAGEVTIEDIREHGQLAIVYNVDDRFGDALNEVYQIGPDGYNGGYTEVTDVYGQKKKLYETELEEDGDYRSSPKTLFGVEPGDIVTKESIEPDVVLTGDALVEFMRQYKTEIDSGIQFSRQRIVGQSSRQYTPEQKAMFERVGRTVTAPTIKERLQGLRKDLGKKMAQGIFDQFHPLKDLDKKAYALARLSKGAHGAFEALLNHGKLSLKDGVYDGDMSGGFIERLGRPLKGELEDFLWWVAAHRADRLTKEDRENLFSADDIAAGKSLIGGTTDFDYTLQHGARAGQVTRDRSLIFPDALKTLDEFNRNTLDMAEQSGLINAESRALWENEFYVPFYRVADEDGGFVGGKIKDGLVRQQAFKRLRGGEEKLNSDLLMNVLSNWAHLIDASAKNRAAKAALEVAAKVGAAIESNETTVRSMGKSGTGLRNHVVWMQDQGVKRFFLVEDPMLLTALTSLEYAGMNNLAMNVMSQFKHWLTIGVTASPAFKIRNLVRDSIQAIGTSELSYNPITNLREGYKASARDSQTYVSALASGGLIRFGTMLEGKQSDHVRRLIKAGVKESTILDSENKVRAFYERYLAPAVEAYNELGNRGEEINRASLFKQLKDQGVDQATAALMARDLTDFSMQGSWTSIRFLTQVVPFMNARLQGLYKLGRAAAEDPKRFSIVLGAVATASIALMLAYEDDDDWKKREDWDRNNNWWFKFGGVAFRIPKPFEIGTIATLAERGLEYAINPEMTGKRLGNNVKDMLLDSLSMNPVPQAFKPLIDLYSNKDSFTGRPIETLGMERLQPQYRYTQATSMTARALSTATGGALSPVQYEHLLRGYFSWLGSFAVGAADMIARPLTDEPERPTADYWRLATQGILQEVSSAQSRYTSQVYDQAKELEQAMGTYRMLLKTGQLEAARAFRAENKAQLNQYAKVERIKTGEARYNELIRMIERSNLDPDVKKERIRKLQDQKDRLARNVAPGYQRVPAAALAP